MLLHYKCTNNSFLSDAKLECLRYTSYPIIREIKWNAFNLKGGNRLASRDVNF